MSAYGGSVWTCPVISGLLHQVLGDEVLEGHECLAPVCIQVVLTQLHGHSAQPRNIQKILRPLPPAHGRPMLHSACAHRMDLVVISLDESTQQQKQSTNVPAAILSIESLIF